MRACFSAAAAALIAGIQFCDLDLLGRAKSRLFQFDFHVVAQIRSATLIFSACATGTTEERLENPASKSGPTEHLAKNLEWIMESFATKTDAARRKCCVTKAIVGSAFVRIHQHIIRFS